MVKVFPPAAVRNEIARTLEKDLVSRPGDFSMTTHYLHDNKRRLKYWIASGMKFMNVSTDTPFADEIYLGSGLRHFPFWWPESGFRAWWAFKKWRHTYAKSLDRRDVTDILKKIREPQ